jgi:phospholipid/cholesterol/gamma-HCH transport system substrate-binding protein
MKTQSEKFKLKLGLFIVGGIALFIAGIFIIGKQKNMFDPVFSISALFYNVSGLQAGNNVRFSGINVGTVDQIRIIDDSTVRVDMLIKQSAQQFIKVDSEVTVGSEGLIGDKLLNISQGSAGNQVVQPGQELTTAEPVETDAIIESLQITALNAEVITGELAQIISNLNSDRGTLEDSFRIQPLPTI